jgi:hypothetical protein
MYKLKAHQIQIVLFSNILAVRQQTYLFCRWSQKGLKQFLWKAVLCLVTTGTCVVFTPSIVSSAVKFPVLMPGRYSQSLIKPFYITLLLIFYILLFILFKQYQYFIFERK